MRLERAQHRLPPGTAPALVLLAGWALCVWLVLRFGPPDLCQFHRLTGRPCPGCGSTRMLLALAGGDPLLALQLHPLGFVALCAGTAWLVLRVGLRQRLVVAESARGWVRVALVLAALVLVHWAYLLATLPPPPGSRHATPQGEASPAAAGAPPSTPQETG